MESLENTKKGEIVREEEYKNGILVAKPKN